MPLGLWNLEWLNLNSQRFYPLADDDTATDTSGSFKIPNSFILELDLPVNAGMAVEPGRFLILNVGAYATGYSVIVGYQPTVGAAVPVAAALIARQTHTPNTVYALGGIAPFDDSVGKIIIGDLSEIDQQPAGFWTFDLDGARLEPDAIRPMIQGVSALILVNGTQKSAPLRGDIELIAGTNVSLVPVLIDGQDPQIIINAINGEGLNNPCVCEGDSALLPPIRRINGIGPTPEGDFELVPLDCVKLDPISHGLRISDTCSKPCCGCPELEKITAALAQLQQDAANVKQFADSLDSAVSAMNSTVLGSKLGDQGCGC